MVAGSLAQVARAVVAQDLLHQAFQGLRVRLTLVAVAVDMLKAVAELAALADPAS